MRLSIAVLLSLVAVALVLVDGAVVPIERACTPAAGSKIRIGSFNVKQMGQSKLGKPDVMAIIYKIMARYDLLLMQEITDVSLKTLPEMLKGVNKIEVANPFSYVASDRLGRTDNKEQYVLWFRSGITVQSTHQYSDPGDIFEREPYLTVVNIPKGKTVQTVGLMHIHIKPSDAVKEINALPTAYDYYRVQLNLPEILIGGDYNADCSYVSQSQLDKLTLRTDTRFVWLIPDDADTNLASGSACAYDRFVVAGDKFVSGLDSCTATPFKFDKEYGLNESYAATVSDHYPIEIQFLTK